MKSIVTQFLRRKLPMPRKGTCFVPAVFVIAAAMVFAPSLNAQSDTPKPAQTQASRPGATLLYSMKFSGGSIDTLEQELKTAFPKDNVVIAPSAKQMRLNLSDFEIRDVRLKELAKTIEFLSDGKLVVEVTEMEEGATGNIWRIGDRLSTNPPVILHLKMRAVAAPQLFSNPAKAEQVQVAALSLEKLRISRIMESARAGASDIFGMGRVELLPEQSIFVIIGNEDGIAGMESFIRAAEQLAVDEAANKMALANSLAPTIRAVFAPHLFNNQERLQRITQEFENVQGLWSEWHAILMHEEGINSRRSGVRVEQRPDQKLFVLVGSEKDIAGMESVIQAAEKHAADQDARELEVMMAQKAEWEATVRKEAEDAEEAKKSDR